MVLDEGSPELMMIALGAFLMWAPHMDSVDGKGSLKPDDPGIMSCVQPLETEYNVALRMRRDPNQEIETLLVAPRRDIQEVQHRHDITEGPVQLPFRHG